MQRLLRVLPILTLSLFAVACDEPEYEDADGNLLGEGLSDDGVFETLSDALHPSKAGYCDSVTDALWNSSWRTLETQVITEINKRRAAGAKCGGVSKPKVGAVKLNAQLRCASRKHSKDMVVKKFFSHTGSNGSTPWARIKAAGYVYKNAAENIAAGQATAIAVVNGWMGSTGHCNNIMNGVLKEVGVGYYPGGMYGHYWTQDFGTK